MTQEEVAEAMGIRHSSVSMYENGVTNIPTSRLRDFLVAIGSSMEELLQRDTASRDVNPGKAAGQ